MRITILLITFFLFFTSNMAAQNCQIHELGTFNQTNATSVLAGERQGQTFTACTTGTITEVQFGLSATHIGGTFNLRIAASALAPSNILVTPAIQTFTTGNGTQNVAVSLTVPFPVTNGQVYAVEIEPTGAADWRWNYASPADYSNGTNYGEQASQFGFVNFASTFDFQVNIVGSAVAPTDVPTLSQWGLIILALLLMTAGTLYLVQPNITTKEA